MAMAITKEKEVEYIIDNLEYLREEYRLAKRTPAQVAAEEQAKHEEMIAKLKLQGHQNLVNFAEGMREWSQGDRHESNKPPAKATWKVTGPNGGTFTITDDASRHWYNASPNDVGAVVLYIGSSYQGNRFAKFVGYEKVHDPIIDVYTDHPLLEFQDGTKESCCSLHPNVNYFEELLLVPPCVLVPGCQEAPPGKFFSGKEVKSQFHRREWSPSPEGRACWWCPCSKESIYLPDADLWKANRFLKLAEMRGLQHVDMEVVNRQYEKYANYFVWCPVLQRFLSEAEMMRQEHWFHNGDGSAHQRFFYNQNEMLDKHGGLDAIPRGAKLQNGQIRFIWNEEEVTVARVRTVDDIVADKFSEAERKGKMIQID